MGRYRLARYTAAVQPCTAQCIEALKLCYKSLEGHGRKIGETTAQECSLFSCNRRQAVCMGRQDRGETREILQITGIRVS